MEENTWNSVKIVEIIISILTPLIGGIIAWRLAKLGKKMDKQKFVGEKIIEKRLSFYDNVVPSLNDLYCYYHRVGNWKELKPTEIIEKKRFLDKQFYVYSHIFKKDILKAYQPFIHKCFQPFNGWGLDAKIMMNLSKRRDLPEWNTDWNELFAEENMVESKQFNKSYFELLNLIRTELEI